MGISKRQQLQSNFQRQRTGKLDHKQGSKLQSRVAGVSLTGNIPPLQSSESSWYRCCNRQTRSCPRNTSDKFARVALAVVYIAAPASTVRVRMFNRVRVEADYAPSSIVF